MNIQEYQAKEILRSFCIPVPNGRVIYDSEDAERAAWRIGTDIAVVKSQIHAGGRGKAGGIKIANSIDDVKRYSKELIGKNLITRQTGPKGKEVKAVLIEEGCNIDKEYYLLNNKRESGYSLNYTLTLFVCSFMSLKLGVI